MRNGRMDCMPRREPRQESLVRGLIPRQESLVRGLHGHDVEGLGNHGHHKVAAHGGGGELEELQALLNQGLLLHAEDLVLDERVDLGLLVEAPGG
eukprot:10155231-Heterocapsa_arctica.AAC.1